MTLWNPTIHPVINFVRVPVTDDYMILDPTGYTVVSDVSMIELGGGIDERNTYSVSFYSIHCYKRSWKDESSSTSAVVQSDTTAIGFQYILFSDQK